MVILLIQQAVWTNQLIKIWTATVILENTITPEPKWSKENQTGDAFPEIRINGMILMVTVMVIIRTAPTLIIVHQNLEIQQLIT